MKMLATNLLKTTIFSLLFCFAISYPDQIIAANAGKNPKPDSTYVYKTINNKSLSLSVYEPKNTHISNEPRPAIVFFHGGAWNTGSKEAFAKKAAYIAEQAGVVAITVQYRVKSRDGTGPHAAVQDAMSAMRWVRQEAGKLGIDPDRIAAGGGSAGGQLALATAILDGQPGYDNSNISAKPNALVLFNPITDTRNWEKMFRRKLRSISPINRLNAPLPPTVIFQGTADKVTPFKQAKKFVGLAKQKGAKNIQLIAFEGSGHGFYNDSEQQLINVLNQTKGFIEDLGWTPQPGSEQNPVPETTPAQADQPIAMAQASNPEDPVLDNYPIPDMPPADPIIQMLNSEEMPGLPEAAQPIPTPAILPLLGAGLLGMMWGMRKRI